jgi:hypothetical protein
VNEEQKARLQLGFRLFYTAAVVGYVGLLVYLTVPAFRLRVQGWAQWARWYQWRANFASLPSWMKEALVVRGHGPPEE